MNQQLLIEDLTRELTQEFTGYELLNKSKVLQQVQVYAQYLPQPQGITFTDKDNAGIKSYTSTDYETNFPCVIVKLIDQTDNEERSFIRSAVNVTILAAVGECRTAEHSGEDS